MELCKVLKEDGGLWVVAFDDNGKICDEILISKPEPPKPPEVELGLNEDNKCKLSKRGKVTIGLAIGGAGLLTIYAIRKRRHRHREGAK